MSVNPSPIDTALHKTLETVWPEIDALHKVLRQHGVPKVIVRPPRGVWLFNQGSDERAPIRLWGVEPVQDNRFCGGAAWPYGDGLKWCRVGCAPQHTHSRAEVVHKIIVFCDGQPRRVLRVVRELEALGRWCEARRAGVARARVEVYRQQQRAMNALQSICAEARLAEV